MEDDPKEKSLAQWRFEVRSNRKNWGGFYQYFIGKPVSSYPRLFKLLTLYGEWVLFEAIVDAGGRNLDINQDPLNYIAKVAANKWKEDQQEEDDISEYLKAVEEAKEKTRERNRSLSQKFERAHRK